MSNILKRWFKRNSHNPVLKVLAGFGRSMNRLYENRNHDIHSNGEVWLLRQLASTNPQVIFDGGANIGEYAIESAENCPSAAVYCFEPVPETFKILEDATREFSSRTILVQKGLSDQNQNLSINIFDSNAHSSIFAHDGITPETKSQLTIEVIKGDDYFHEKRLEKIDFLKLDVEGAEMKALKGFEKCLKEKRIRVIQLEYGYINILTKNLLMDYYDYLLPFGFKLGKLYPKKVEFRPYHNKLEDFIGPNYVAVHESEKELIQLLS